MPSAATGRAAAPTAISIAASATRASPELVREGELGPARDGLAFGRLQPFPGDRLGALVGDEVAPASLLLGADRLRVLAELRPHRHRLFDRRALADLGEPAFDIRELVDVDLAARPARCPRIADHVGDRVLAGGKIPLVEQTEVHDPVDAMGLIVEAAQRIGEVAVASGLLGAPEMALLAELWALIGQLPADPLGNIVSAAHVLRIEASGLLGEIHHDRPGLEDRDRRAAAQRLGIDYCRHPAVWRDPQKMRGELIAATDIDRLDRVGHPELFEQYDGLLAISCGPKIQVDHGIFSCFQDWSMWIVTTAGTDCPPCCRRARRSA